MNVVMESFFQGRWMSRSCRDCHLIRALHEDEVVVIDDNGGWVLGSRILFLEWKDEGWPVA